MTDAFMPELRNGYTGWIYGLPSTLFEHGFVDCEPFADYQLDPHSRFCH